MKYSRLEQAIVTLNQLQLKSADDSRLSVIDARALLVVTIIYIVALLSIPLERTDIIIWFAIYPIVSAPLANIAYERLLVSSLYVLPLLILVGIFNPFFDRVPAFTVAGITVSAGWVSFISILIRGLLSVQALLLLIRVSGFNNICEAMRRLGVPTVLVTQLLMVYRYMTVLLQEGLSMQRARLARSCGRSGMRMSMWGSFVGQLLLRTVERSRRINMAMKARGFNGSLHMDTVGCWSMTDTVYIAVWTAVFAALRFCDVPQLMLNMINYR